MKIYSPLKNSRITQGFGESKACVITDHNGRPYRPFQVIGKTGETCPPASTDFYRAIGLNAHNGTDYSAYHGQPMYFNCDAPVEWYAKNEFDMDGGIGLDVISKQPIDGKFYKFRFWHLLDSKIPDGQPVKFGQLIARADNTGASSGNHLHHSLKEVDENGRTLNKDNGYRGAIDMTPWYEDRFVLDVLKLKEQVQYKYLLQKVVFLLQTYVNMLVKKYGKKGMV